MKKSIVFLFFILFTAGLMAQGFVAPPLLTKFKGDPVFTAANIPGTDFAQIHMVPYPGKPGQFITAITVFKGLPTSWGGAGGQDFLTGVYDAVNKKFTADLHAKNLNTTMDEFGLTLFHNGLFAVFERFSGGHKGVFFAWRQSVTQDFTIKGQITGLPTMSKNMYFDPAIAILNGTLHFIYHVHNNTSNKDYIAAAPLNIATLAVDTTKSVILVKNPKTGTEQPNSPTPIVTSTGELLGLSHHLTTNKNDHYMSFDTNPNTPALEFINYPDWINNGGYAGGTFFDAWYTPGFRYKIGSVETVWWTGGKAPIGSNMEVSAYVPIGGPTGPAYISFILISNGFLANPIPVPGIIGKFGLNYAYIEPISMGPHNPLTGKAVVNLPIPNVTALKGLSVPGQLFTVKNTAQGKTYILANTAALNIQ